MTRRDNIAGWASGHRLWTTLAIYTGAGFLTVQLLTTARQHFGLPDSLDSGLLAVFVAGFLAMIMLLKTRIAGGASPILHALQAVAVVLLFAAAGLLIAYWLEPTAPALVTILS
jgi:hypothetical protein